MTVEALIKMPPTAGASVIPAQAKTPAAQASTHLRYELVSREESGAGFVCSGIRAR